MRPRIQQLHQSQATDGKVPVWKDSVGLWVPGRVTWRELYGYPGALAVTTGLSEVPIDVDCYLVSVIARVSTAPTGASIKVDLNRNGTTVFTTQANRPEILATQKSSSTVTNMDVTSLLAGDYLSVDIDQIGSTLAGSDLVVAVRLREKP